jgi:hypothetical protein
MHTTYAVRKMRSDHVDRTRTSKAKRETVERRRLRKLKASSR